MNVELIATGLIYRNPKAHVRSVHAYFPSVATLPNGEMLATLALGEAFEAVNSHTYLARSTDGGENWQLEGRICEDPPGRLTSDSSRITALPDGDLVVFMVRCDRTDHPQEGLTNHENLGFVPMEMLLLRSSDAGRTWGAPELIDPPLVGPAFELCCPITPLEDGRWLLPTSTWRGWDGCCPNGTRMIAFVSHDHGRSWPEYFDVLRDPEQHIVYWESKIVELSDGRLLAAAWAYDEQAAKDLPNQFTLSHDGGQTWSPPKSTGLIGQTLTPFVVDGGRILCVYRRMDQTGLWANVSHFEGDDWVNDDCLPLWGAGQNGLTSTSANMAQNFNVLRFGAPCLTQASDGTIFVAFWCYEDCVSVIRWLKLRVENPSQAE